MRHSSPYVIKIAGLSEGEFEYSFRLDDSFFESFENSPVKSGNFEVNVLLVKKSNHLELEFDFVGVEDTVCDRCLADISLPVEGILPLIIKYSDEVREEEEVVYIPYNSPNVDLKRYIYELVCLLVPMRKLCEDAEGNNTGCNIEELNINDNLEEDQSEETNNPFADSLKNLKL